MKYCLARMLLLLVAAFAANAYAQVITTFPYNEDFESTDGGWTAGGTLSSWAWGAPNGRTTAVLGATGITGGANSTTNAWVTNLGAGGSTGGPYNEGEISYLESPVFDFSAFASDPTISLEVWYECVASRDGAILVVSTNGGTTWAQVGALNDPNWYISYSPCQGLDNNLSTIGISSRSGCWQGHPGHSSLKGSLGWQSVSHVLNGTAGQSDVRFRFWFCDEGAVGGVGPWEGFAVDEIEISLPPKIDLLYNSSSVTSTTGGLNMLNLGAVSTANQQLTFEIFNVGGEPLQLTGSPLVQLTPTSVTGLMLAGAPPSSPVPAQQVSSFDVGFVAAPPTGSTVFEFDLVIESNDPTVPSYSLYVFGTFNNNGEPVVGVASGSNFQQIGPTPVLFELNLDPGDSIADALEITDPDNDTMTVVVTAPSFVGLTAQPSSVTTPVQGPISLQWVGTADPSNAPITAVHDWTLEVDDGNGNQITVTARITINDLPPQHAIVNATSGDGSSATPYTIAYTETQTGAVLVDLASVSDPNQQTVVLGTIVPDAGNPSGGSGFSFGINAGQLEVNPAGTLAAADVGIHLFDVPIRDAAVGGNSVSVWVEVTVNGIPAITTSSPLPNGEQGVVYGPLQIVANGGTGALAYSTTTLPAGLNLSATGVLDGTPQVTAGAPPAVFTVTVEDTFGIQGTQQFQLTIDPPSTGNPSITTTALPAGEEGKIYGPVAISATGGSGVGYTFGVTGGALPAGMTLSTGGSLGGTPTSAGVYNFDITVTDSVFATGTTSLVLQVNGPGSGGGSGGGDGGGGGCAGSVLTGSSPVVVLVALLALIACVRLRRRV